MGLTDAQESEEGVSLLPSPGDGRPKLSSFKKTLGNLIVSIVGAGVLGLPYAFKKSGLLFSLVTLVAMALVSYYGMMLLVKSRKKLEETLGDNMEVSSYGDLAYRLYGSVGLWAVDAMIFLSQGGFCVAYLIFIGQNVSSIITGGLEKKALVIALLAPLEMMLSWLRSLSRLAPFSIFADFANGVAFSIVGYYGCINFKGFSDISMYNGLSNTPMAIGVAVYAFEGVGMTLALESSMKERPKFGSALALAITIIALIYGLVGTMGYVGFGADTKEIITLNLPSNWSTDLVKLGICVALFFTFPVMMHPVYEIHERRLSSSAWMQANVYSHERLRKIVLRSLRSLMVAFIAYVAIAVPHFSTFISLIGSSVCSMLAFVLPALFYLKVMRQSISQMDFCACWLLVVFGLVFGVWGTYDSVQRMFTSPVLPPAT